MFCERCQSFMPKAALSCPRCAREKSRAATRRSQYHPLREVEAGRAKFTTRQFDGAVHLKMFGYALTFCELEIDTGRIGDAAMSAIHSPMICKRCRKAVEEIGDAARIDERQARSVSHS